jgi:hypothetical protein
VKFRFLKPTSSGDPTLFRSSSGTDAMIWSPKSAMASRVGTPLKEGRPLVELRCSRASTFKVLMNCASITSAGNSFEKIA